jgi:molybdopterin-containing oxidoreductase family iron-sulfur binding subunit
MSERYDNLLLVDPATNAPPPRSVDRRDFLKTAGFTLGAALIAGCRPARVEKAIPFLVKPEEVTPGVSTWYATTCGACGAGCGVMAKNRDGRPVKLEGIPGHPVSDGGLCPAGQAHLLMLYDSERLLTPMVSGAPARWEDIDASISARLEEIVRAGGAIRLLTGTITSPTTLEEVRKFLVRFPGSRHVQYDPLSSSAILDAHVRTHGLRALPHYRFEVAEVIVSFDADFLATWISPVEYTAAYHAGRRLDGSASRHSFHVQYESRLSLTGSNADRRVRRTPAEIRSAIATLAALLEKKASSSPLSGGAGDAELAALANRLWDHRGRSLVVSGVNDIDSQLSINAINSLLGNYGTTLDLASPSYQKQGSDGALEELLAEIRGGKISALILRGANPVYDLPDGAALAAAIASVPLTVSCSDRLDETTGVVRFACPEPHSLESWNDGAPVRGIFTITQPVIAPFGSTRTFAENLARWTGDPLPAYELLRRHWESAVFPLQAAEATFQSFWDASVYQGFARAGAPVLPSPEYRPGAMKDASPPPALGAEDLALVLYPTSAMLDGRHAHNPWLQELPDPVSKIVWDNYASLSAVTAQSVGAREGDIVRIDAAGTFIELPVHIQPGQHDRVVAVALGYGRKGTDRFARIGPQWLESRPTVPVGGLVGTNAAVLLRRGNGSIVYDGLPVRLALTGRSSILACTQEHHSLHVPEHLAPKDAERRPIIQETSLAEYRTDPASGSFEKETLVTMWPADHPYSGHHWGMTIDLSACTGCSACVVSCQAENNIPLVGKDEVYRNREMTWIRIDRYYDESPSGDVEVQHQPMMCQHCGNAPCETVCPVLATVHSDEGLNQQVYNRCVGTRYCSNNCPYKVRRFNWFEYDHGDDMRRLVLNPDIAVRERGIMEKCSMCVQRIQEGKIEAKKNGIPVKDGDISPACAQSCPAKAIVFGDMNDPSSRLVGQMNDPRAYRVLEEIGVRPSVSYMTLVRNRLEGGEDHV